MHRSSEQSAQASISKGQIPRIVFALVLCAAAFLSVPSIFAWAIYDVLSDNPQFTQYLLYGIPSVLLLLFSVLRNAVVPGISGMAAMYLAVSSAQAEWLLAAFGLLFLFFSILIGIALGSFTLSVLLPKPVPSTTHAAGQSPSAC